jgi:hypothetical protein
MKSGTQRYMFRMADCAAIVNELNVVDWFSLLSEKKLIVASTCAKRWSGAALKNMYSRGFLVAVGNNYGSQAS